MKTHVQDVVKVAQQQIQCFGCCSAIKSLMEQPLSSTGDRLLQSLLEETESGDLVLRQQYMDDGDGVKFGKLFRMFDLGKWKDTQAKMQLGKCKASRLTQRCHKRCNLHALEPNLGSDDWEGRWCSLPADTQGRVLNVKTGELWSAIVRYFRKLQFCVDCRRNVVHAFEVLVSPPPPSPILFSSTITPMRFAHYIRHPHRSAAFSSNPFVWIPSDSPGKFPPTNYGNNALKMIYTMVICGMLSPFPTSIILPVTSTVGEIVLLCLHGVPDTY
jgi:hypothetical protein